MQHSLLAVFFLGVSLGVGGGWWLAGQLAAPEPQAPVAAERAALATLQPAPSPLPLIEIEQTEPDAAQAAVWVRVLDDAGRVIERYPTAFVGPGRVVVLPGRVLFQANNLEFDSGSGDVRRLTRVIAGDRYGVAAIPGGTAAAAYLTPADEDHPLYLGRSVLLLLPDGSTPAVIDGPQQAWAYGEDLITPVRPSVSLALPEGGVLVDPEDWTFLGLVVGSLDDGERLAVLDVTAVRDLVSRPRAVEELVPLPVFVHRFRTTTSEGLRLAFERAVEESALPAALTAARHWAAHVPEATDSLPARLEPLLSEEVAALLSQGRVNTAARLVGEARQVLDASPGLALLSARIAIAEGDVSAALARLQAWRTRAPHRVAEAMATIRDDIIAAAHARAEGVGGDEIEGTLTLAESLDPDHAAYAMELGRIYSSRGDYADAVAAFERAMRLEPALETALADLVTEARVQLENPAETWVPYVRERGVSYVDVTLNDYPKPFRFILDTGATHTAISRRVAAILGLGQTSDARAVTVQTAGGPQSAVLVSLDAVDLADMHAESVPAVVLGQLGAADGLLGLSFLDRFDVDLRRGQGYVALRRRE